MKARRVARELALLCLTQLSKHTENLDNQAIDDLVLLSIRTLNDFALTNLKYTLNDLIGIKEYLDDLEINSPDNLERPMEAKNLPVEIPDTAKLKTMVDSLLESAEYVLHSTEVLELTALSEKEGVKTYALRLVKTFMENQEFIDENINTFSEGWNFDRLLKLDRNILRLAFTEIKYFKKTPNAVVADEAVELAKKYSSEESPRFINGVLGQFISNTEKIDSKEKESV